MLAILFVSSKLFYYETRSGTIQVHYSYYVMLKALYESVEVTT